MILDKRSVNGIKIAAVIIIAVKLCIIVTSKNTLQIINVVTIIATFIA